MAHQRVFITLSFLIVIASAFIPVSSDDPNDPNPASITPFPSKPELLPVLTKSSTKLSNPASSSESSSDGSAIVAAAPAPLVIDESGGNNDKSKKSNDDKTYSAVHSINNSASTLVDNNNNNNNKALNSTTRNGSTDKDGDVNTDNDSTFEKEGEKAEEKEKEESDPRFSVETFVTIAITLTIVLSNCTIIMVAAWTEAFHNFNKIFIYSMTLADLLIGLFVTPYSIFLSVYRRWLFAGETFCNIEAYVLMCLSAAKLFSLTWLNVDHYIAVRKPERYNVMMSQTRSLCWVFCCWLAPISFCIPPVFSFESSVFNDAVYICQANTHVQIAYVATAGALITLPALVALVVTNAYIFTKSYKKRITFYEKVFVELATRPWKYQMTFIMCIVLLLVWLPYLLIFGVEKITVERYIPPQVHFYFFWLGICSSFTNMFVLLFMCSDFRRAVRDLYRMSEWCPLYRSRSNDRRYGYTSDVNVITIQKKC